MTVSEADAVVRKYAPKVVQTDTAATLAERLNIGPSYAKKVLAVLRARGVLPPSKHATSSPPPAKTDKEPKPAEVIETPPTVDISPDGTAHAWSVDVRIRTPEELIAAADLDLNIWEVVKAKVNSWPVASKNRDTGEATVTRLWQVSLDLRPRLLPLMPLVEWLPPQPYHVTPAFEDHGDSRRAVILPDMQIGYKWVLDAPTPYLEPTHDRAAIDLALRLITEVEPTDVVLLGDNLDFAPLSTRWPVEDAQRQVTRLALMEYRWLLQRLVEVSGNARIIYCEGNHEERWSKYLKERAGELVSVVPTLPSLLTLSDLGIEWVPYRAEAWLWERIRVIHGEVVRAGGGATAAAVLAKETHSVVYGHIHRAEVARRRTTAPGGEAYVWAMSPGCLCRVDGAVPGSTPRTDWQQGVGVITSAPGALDAVDTVLIQNGRGIYRGKVFTGNDYTDLLVESSGVTAFRRGTS